MRHERAIDLGVVLLAGLFAVAGLPAAVPVLPEPFDALAFWLVAAGVAALWWRRAAPATVAWSIVALTCALVVAVRVWPGPVAGVGLDPDTAVLPSAAPFAAYAVGAFARRRAAWLPLCLLAGAALAGAAPASRPTAVVGIVVTVVAVPAVLGRYVASRRDAAERERSRRADEVRREERLRLAAEVHDIVGHRLSAMVLQAGALELTAAEGSTRRAAEELRAGGCVALDELRELVGLLSAADRAAPVVVEPFPDLADLVAASESVGIPVDVAEDGDPRPVSPVVGRTAYRVVQEALTNVRKHAPDTRVRVRVSHRPDGVRLTIDNTAPSAGASGLGSAGGGTGLLGLRRRVELVDGAVRAGPRPGGGFRVEAELPAAPPP